MYKYLLFICFGYTQMLLAQQDGYQTHFQFNEVSYNPAYAGKQEHQICISSLFHQQYLGFKSDAITDFENKTVIRSYNIAPRTQYLTVSARCFENLGISLHFMKDEIGPQQIKLPKINLAWYFKIKNASLALGFYSGIMQKSLDGNMLVPLSQLQALFIPDPAVPNSPVTDHKFDMGMGIHYNNPLLSNIHIGISATHLLNANFTFRNSSGEINSFSSLKKHYYFNLSADMPAGIYKLLLQPSLLLKYGSRFQADLNILAIYNQLCYAGVSVRQGDNTNIMAGFINKNFKIGYAFDFVLSPLKPGTRTSYELFIQYCYAIKTRGNPVLNPRHLHESLN